MGFLDAYVLLAVLAFLSVPLGKRYRYRYKSFPFYWSTISCLGVLVTGILVYTGVLDFAVLFLRDTLPWFEPATGKELAWNGFAILGAWFAIDPVPSMAPIAAILFLSYPAWYAYVKRVCRMLFGIKGYQGGIAWMFEDGNGKKRKQNK